MNFTTSHTPKLVAIARLIALVAAAVTAVFAAHLVASWLAPIVAVPLLVGSWLLGIGLAIFLPFALVVAVAAVVAR